MRAAAVDVPARGLGVDRGLDSAFGFDFGFGFGFGVAACHMVRCSRAMRLAVWENSLA